MKNKEKIEGEEHRNHVVLWKSLYLSNIPFLKQIKVSGELFNCQRLNSCRKSRKITHTYSKIE
jgi:hypothetical protein